MGWSADVLLYSFHLKVGPWSIILEDADAKGSKSSKHMGVALSNLLCPLKIYFPWNFTGIYGRQGQDSGKTSHALYILNTFLINLNSQKKIYVIILHESE